MSHARRPRTHLACVLGLLAALLLPGTAWSQDRDAPLTLGVQRADGSLTLAMGDLFRDPGLVDAVESGLPLRIEVKSELWKDGLFDSQHAAGTWRGTVFFDPLGGQYHVALGTEGATELSADSLPGVMEALRSSLSIPLRPFEDGRYYYMAQIQVETLSLDDLGELQRWLHGDASPEIRGESRTGSMVGRGVQRMFGRVLGIPARRFRTRTESFDFEARRRPPRGPA